MVEMFDNDFNNNKNIRRGVIEENKFTLNHLNNNQNQKVNFLRKQNIKKIIHQKRLRFSFITPKDEFSERIVILKDYFLSRIDSNIVIKILIEYF